MKIKNMILPLILITVLIVVVCWGFLLKSNPKNTDAQMEAIAKQEQKIAELNEKIAGQNSKIAEQDKLLSAQDKRFAELAAITERLNKIQAALNTSEVDINDSDMAQIRQMIEEQVKLNVKKADLPPIGVVSIRRIFRDCKKTAQYRQEANTERQQVNAELTKLDNEISAQKEGLKTLKTGSENYMAQVKVILEKQANLQARQEFHKQQMTLKEQRITETIYGDILRITAVIAKEKGLDLVFETSEPELPATNPSQLELSMGMHKLLYGGGCQDITDDVITRLDSEK